MTNGKCKGCGAPITWAKTREGKTIPLTQVSHVYGIDFIGPEVAAFDIEAPRGAYVSHFLTCPKANDFSGSKRKAAQQGDFPI